MAWPAGDGGAREIWCSLLETVGRGRKGVVWGQWRDWDLSDFKALSTVCACAKTCAKTRACMINFIMTSPDHKTFYYAQTSGLWHL